MPTTQADRDRKKAILEAVRVQGFVNAATDRTIRPKMEEEADSDAADRVVTHDLLRVADAIRASRVQGPPLALFRSTDDVIIVPGRAGTQTDRRPARVGPLRGDVVVGHGLARDLHHRDRRIG